jgi:ribonuclease P protein component
VLRDRTLPVSRFGIAVSKKVSKKAVIRNRIKRQIRAVIRTLLPIIDPDWNIIVVVLPSAVMCKYEHFLRELEQLFKEAEIIHHGH